MVADLLTCSAKGCQAEARWTLLWNNPRLHAPERRKEWLACEQHREFLGSFLAARGFLKETRELAAGPDSPREPAAQPDASAADG